VIRARVEWVVARLGFPCLITGTVLATLRAIERGVDPARAVAAPIALGYVALAVLELAVPWEPSWRRSHGDLGEDVGLFLTNTAVIALVQPILLAVAVGIAGELTMRLGGGLWPLTWPLLAQLGLALLVGELFEYTFHRAMHEVPGLWRVHATHHSAPRLYWLNSVRFHPIDLFFVATVRVAALVVLGCGQEVVALATVFAAIHGAYQHANVPVHIGPFNWVFSMTELHRWHHSPDAAEANHNYGGNLIVWDVVFGTRFLPADREPPRAIGIGDMPAFPHGLLWQLAVPFRWTHVRAIAARRQPT
jgi:sterol desaturase/sphingolipid hydroxylase (fatty acid hydroxylase superfamily)